MKQVLLNNLLSVAIRGSGLVGPEGPGIGYASTGSGEGLSDREGTGGTEADVGGGGIFSYDGYWSNLQSAINSNYPTDAYTMGNSR